MDTLSLIYICSLIMLFCGGWSFVSNRKHLLNTLLSLFIYLFIYMQEGTLGYEGTENKVLLSFTIL